jgi:hypothetical protein
MTGTFKPTAPDLRYILGAARDSGRRGFKRTVRLLRPRRRDMSGHIGWGWKVPSTHAYIDFLDAHFPNLKYIHLIRHGLDMAYSKTVGQLFDFASLYGVERPNAPEDIPPAFLTFWVRANREALSIGERMGPERFLCVRFHALCQQPKEQVERIMAFLGVTLSDAEMAPLAAIPRIPSSAGRYKDHDLDGFDPADIEAVRALGFSV